MIARPPDSGRELPNGLPRPYRVTATRLENHRTRTVFLDGPVDAEPGQFCMLWLPGLDEKPFSVASARPAAFTIAAVGPFSRAIHALAPGDHLWLRGPFGRPFKLEGGDALLVGGGYGVAPMLLLAGRALASGHRVRVAIGARDAGELLLAQAFRDLGIEPILTTDDGSAGRRGRVTEALAPLLREDPPDTLYACGPHGMLAALAGIARDRGLRAQLSWEAYMRCGIGICGSCEQDGRLLCADGPVLREAAPC